MGQIYFSAGVVKKIVSVRKDGGRLIDREAVRGY
jgi:hypothetical protein